MVRSFAISKDGTRVPLNIIRRKGARLDGTNPVLLTGYGGYGISLKPSFAGSQTAFGWIREASQPQRTCVVAANTARNGTSKAI